MSPLDAGFHSHSKLAAAADGGVALLAAAAGAQLRAAVCGPQLPPLARPAGIALLCVPAAVFCAALVFFFF